MGLFCDTGNERMKGAIRALDETRNYPIHGVMPESGDVLRTPPLY
jgi:hypothetical protein